MFLSIFICAFMMMCMKLKCKRKNYIKAKETSAMHEAGEVATKPLSRKLERHAAEGPQAAPQSHQERRLLLPS